MDTRRDRPSNRRQQLQDVAQAQATAGAPPAKSHGLDVVAAQLRSRVRNRRAQAVWDAAYEAQPGAETLRLVQAILATQAFEVARLQKDLETAKSKDTREGIAALLIEVRRNGRHLKALCDGLTKAAKVSAEINLDTLPDSITFHGVSALRGQLTGEDEPAVH